MVGKKILMLFKNKFSNNHLPPPYATALPYLDTDRLSLTLEVSLVPTIVTEII